MLAKTAAERMAAQRKRRKRLGLQRYEFWLTEEENKAIKTWIKVHRHKVR